MSKDSCGSYVWWEETVCRKTREEVSNDLGPELGCTWRGGKRYETALIWDRMWCQNVDGEQMAIEEKRWQIPFIFGQKTERVFRRGGMKVELWICWIWAAFQTSRWRCAKGRRKNGFGIWKTKWEGMPIGELSTWKQQPKTVELGGLAQEVCTIIRGEDTKSPTIGHGFFIWLIHQNPHSEWKYGTQPIFS